MKIANKKEFPLVVVKEVSIIRAKARELARENQGIFTYQENDNSIAIFRDVDQNSKFSFFIHGSYLGKDGQVYTEISYAPTDQHRIEQNTYSGTTDVILELLNQWIDIIRQYNEISLTEAEQLDAAAEKEIYDLFDFVDDDADTAAFDLKQQLYLDDALANMEATLEVKKEVYEVAEIIEEVKELRNSLPVETKKTFGKKISKLFVAVKKKGIPLFKEIIKEFFKDMAKKGIDGGFQRLIEYFQ